MNSLNAKWNTWELKIKGMKLKRVKLIKKLLFFINWKNNSKINKQIYNNLKLNNSLSSKFSKKLLSNKSKSLRNKKFLNGQTKNKEQEVLLKQISVGKIWFHSISGVKIAENELIFKIIVYFVLLDKKHKIIIWLNSSYLILFIANNVFYIPSKIVDC